jgi:hypothetical protein
MTSKVAIVQYDNRSDEQLGSLCDLIDTNARYAKRYGYTHAFQRGSSFGIPNYWVKPWAVLDAFSRGFDIVMWIDSDAVIHDFNRPIESLFKGDELFVYAPDCPEWSGKFNAGVFVVKREGRHIVEDWVNLYDSTKWFQSDGHWHCRGEWAGPDYEQGAFTKHLVPRYESSLGKVDWRVLQSPYPVRESFTVHFAGHFRALTNIYWLTEGVKHRDQ